jgi:alpha-galactosidase
MATGVKTPTLDRLQLKGNHWSARTVEFFDYTDWNDNLITERTWLPYRRNTYRGNLLFAHDVATRQGFFFLKEAPCSSTQLHYNGSDFVADFSDFMVVGLGIVSNDVKPDSWIRIYGCVIGIYTGDEQEALTALRLYQKQLRHHTAAQDEMIMLNTWGDRSQDAKIDEAFCLAELDRAARMGITLFQLDDGWQSGKSPNSKTAGGSFKDIWKNTDYWTPNPMKFPHGLKPIVEKGKKLGIRIGLWFNPSIQNDFADWQKDAQAIIGLYKKYGICCFKIDGLQIPTKTAEQNLRRLFDTVLEQTNHEVIFNLDATAGRRGGYHYMNEYGNIFLENRYTDWGNYYPYRTLRNLWMLSRYVPAEKMQIEFLNKWRNADKYDAADPFAPARYSFDYLFAITLAAQPLAWMEASNLPGEAYATASLLKAYQSLQLRFHKGVILPIGEEPSGRSWTGFQSIVSDTEGYLIVYREDNGQAEGTIDTWLPKGKKVTFTPVMGSGRKSTAKVGAQGKVSFELKDKNSFALYQYRIK